nr:hypothetical protein [Burkholderia vietnamiensis]
MHPPDLGQYAHRDHLCIPCSKIEQGIQSRGSKFDENYSLRWVSSAWTSTRKPQRDPTTVLQLILRSTPDKPKRGWPYLPWMAVIDAHFKLFGFEPGDRVYFEINHDTRQMHITPHYGDLDFREQPYHQPD